MQITDIKEQMRRAAEQQYHDSLKSIDSKVDAAWEQCRLELAIIDDSELAMQASVQANFERQRQAVMRRYGLLIEPAQEATS